MYVFMLENYYQLKLALHTKMLRPSTHVPFPPPIRSKLADDDTYTQLRFHVGGKIATQVQQSYGTDYILWEITKPRYSSILLMREMYSNEG